MADAPLRSVTAGEGIIPAGHEFFRVSKLVPTDQDVVSVPPGTRVRAALALMSETGYSQIPVVAGTTVIGVFTYRSLARELATVRRQDDPLDAPVDDLLEDLAFVRASDEVGDILRHLDADGAVLVGDETNVIAVATSTDVIDFLWETTRPFVLLQDVELAVRDLIRSACPATVELEERIAAAFPSDVDATPGLLEELTLSELLRVVTHPNNFGQCFRNRFGGSRDLVNSKLEPVRDIRNKVFHFRDEVTADELNILVDARRWLLRKVLAARPS